MEREIDNRSNRKAWPNSTLPQPAYEFEVWLPLYSYRIGIRYKLLSQLGQISHFLILALTKRAFNFEQLAVLTALQPVQLFPIHKRLVELQIINGERLSKTEQRYAYYLQFLHAKDASFWLDEHYKNLPVLISISHPALGDIPKDVPVVDSSRGYRGNAREESARQKVRLEKADVHYGWLAWLFPAFKTMPLAEDNKWTEWDLELRVSDHFDSNQAEKGFCRVSGCSA